MICKVLLDNARTTLSLQEACIKLITLAKILAETIASCKNLATIKFFNFNVMCSLKGITFQRYYFLKVLLICHRCGYTYAANHCLFLVQYISLQNSFEVGFVGVGVSSEIPILKTRVQVSPVQCKAV